VTLDNAKTTEIWIIFVIENTTTTIIIIIKFIGEFGFYGLKTYILCYSIFSMT
jgi:hypothetical protein